MCACACVCVSECAIKMAAGPDEGNKPSPSYVYDMWRGSERCVCVCVCSCQIRESYKMHAEKDCEEHNMTNINFQITYNQNITATPIKLMNITR